MSSSLNLPAPVPHVIVSMEGEDGFSAQVKDYGKERYVVSFGRDLTEQDCDDLAILCGDLMTHITRSEPKTHVSVSKQNPAHVIFDFSNITSVDKAALHPMMGIHKGFQRRGDIGEVSFAGVSRTVMERSFRPVHLDVVFTGHLHTDVANALNATLQQAPVVG